MLKRFWFIFDSTNKLPPGIRIGCGVTAIDLIDAQRILKEKVFFSDTYVIIKTIEDVDVSTLDSNHILPNMNPPDKRGVWFPLGYT